jgi:hypothetical protein
MTFCHPELVTSPTRDCVLSEARGSALDATSHFTTVFCASLFLHHCLVSPGSHRRTGRAVAGFSNGLSRLRWHRLQGFLLGRARGQGRATKGFEEHVREVKERVPPERLLVYEVREGWGPVCAFLGVEAPQGEPFPHLNEGEQFPRLMRRAVLSELAPRLSKAAAAVALGVWALGRVLRRRA